MSSVAYKAESITKVNLALVIGNSCRNGERILRQCREHINIRTLDLPESFKGAKSVDTVANL